MDCGSGYGRQAPRDHVLSPSRVVSSGCRTYKSDLCEIWALPSGRPGKRALPSWPYAQTRSLGARRSLFCQRGCSRRSASYDCKGQPVLPEHCREVRLRVLILATLSVATLAAHPGAPSLWTIQARANGITGRIVLALQDLSGVRELDRNNDGVIDGPEAIGQISMLTRTLLRHFVLRSTNGPLAATVLRLRQPNATEIELFVRYDIPPEV